VIGADGEIVQKKEKLVNSGVQVVIIAMSSIIAFKPNQVGPHRKEGA